MKKEKYQKCLNTLDSLYKNEKNFITKLSCTAAVLKSEFNFLWVGFYLKDEKESNLSLGPFQGPLACTRIPFGKGVCGDSWKYEKPIVVDNVDLYAGHISCSPESKSEIVCPIIKDGVILGVLDIDSTEYSNFDELDLEGIKGIMTHLADSW